MGDPTARRKTYKLKEPVTRDSFNTWDLNHRAFCRQDKDWQQFLPSGTRENWAAYEDATRGITITKVDNGNNVLDKEQTNKVRSALEDFLVTLGPYALEHFLYTVINEATSYKWVLNRIKTTFRLNTRGVSFLGLDNMNLTFVEDGITYQQGFQAIK